MRYSISVLSLMVLTACTGIPQGIPAITGFELNRYLGTWYEIARLDHSFERGLSDIKAEYSLQADGSVKVLNSGYDAIEGERRFAEGKAYFVGQTDVGQLKVSFFGPFYAAYNIIALDKTAYGYAMITGPNRDYLWILARSPDIDQQSLKQLIAKANSLGFDTGMLIFDHH